MKCDINEVNHYYIMKLVILSIFLFKRQIRNRTLYENSVHTFIKKRVIWDIDFYMEHVEVDKSEDRNSILKSLLNKDKSDWENNPIHFVNIKFKTPLKKIEMTIDTRDEEKYEKFIYS